MMSESFKLLRVSGRQREWWDGRARSLTPPAPSLLDRSNRRESHALVAGFLI